MATVAQTPYLEEKKPKTSCREQSNWQCQSFFPSSGAIYLSTTGSIQPSDIVKADVMTTPGSNSGLYFHTKYQPEGWPSIGYEAQVNNTHGDPKKTGGLYGVSDVFQAPAEDGEWFTQEIIVEGKHIVIKVDGEALVDYTEPDDVSGGRKLSSGTFAIQAHDPKSKVFFKNIVVKPLD